MPRNKPKRRPKVELDDFVSPYRQQHNVIILHGMQNSRYSHSSPSPRVLDQRIIDLYWLREFLSPLADRDGLAHRVKARTEGRLTPERDGTNGLWYLVGRRLRDDWDFATLPARLTANLEGFSASKADFTGRQLDAKQRKDRALASVGHPLRLVLIHVVCCDGLATQWAKGRGWHEKMGIGALRLALESLQHHYRLT